MGAHLGQRSTVLSEHATCPPIGGAMGPVNNHFGSILVPYCITETLSCICVFGTGVHHAHRNNVLCGNPNCGINGEPRAPKLPLLVDFGTPSIVAKRLHGCGWLLAGGTYWPKKHGVK